ncbi:hypothetical protein HF086_005298 [Spodoptera exigua]|uniref:CCHC-type domain-containing protein n=1 Tax=Spodoptera exigua TaxID=7107 RepID=A0A922SSV2_SPOEX|nr:hypothetical protein HF086_005298 [Spodoptera exigua]
MPKTRGQTANEDSSSDEERMDQHTAGAAARANSASASATPTTTDRCDVNMITMSEDQLSRILASVMRGTTQLPATNAGVHAVHTTHSNFTRCTARFDGTACNADVVEAFIESVLVYKECADSSSATPKRVRPRCARCKRFGHTTDECKSKGNELACYGCGREGVIRSKCPTCKDKGKEDAVADRKVSFQSAYTRDSPVSRPTIEIEVASLVGVAVLDTGATESLASPGLYKILVNNGTNFTSARRTIGLADGTQHTRDVLLCDTNVVLQGRNIPTTFIIIPEADNKTLLGQDFIAKSGILLDLQRSCWYFSDSTEVKVPFVRSYSLASTSDAELMQVDTTGLALRETEGSKLLPAQRTQLNQLIVSRAARFATEGPATSYATHHIRVSDGQEPIASPPYRMSAVEGQQCKYGLILNTLLDRCQDKNCQVALLRKKEEFEFGMLP